jgi:hypothetical protein
MDFDKCHNLPKQNVKLILKILSDLEPLRGSSNKKTMYLFNSFMCKLGIFFTSDNEPEGIENATHNTFIKPLKNVFEP